MRPHSRSNRDVVALAVLGLLSEEPRHPYEMQRLLRERHKDFAANKTRALYHAVDRLDREGLIEPVETSRDGKRPERTVYRMTASGSDELQAWLTDLLETPTEDEFPIFQVAVSFLGCLTPDVALAALRQRVASQEGSLKAFDAIMEALRRVGLTRMMLLENEHRRALLDAELRWARSIVEDIEAGRLTWDPMPYAIKLDPELIAKFEAEHMS